MFSNCFVFISNYFTYKPIEWVKKNLYNLVCRTFIKVPILFLMNSKLILTNDKSSQSLKYLLLFKQIYQSEQ